MVCKRKAMLKLSLVHLGKSKGIVDLYSLSSTYYSFIDPKRMNGWVRHVGWHTVDVYPGEVTCQLQVLAQDRESSPVIGQHTVVCHQSRMRFLVQNLICSCPRDKWIRIYILVRLSYRPGSNFSYAVEHVKQIYKTINNDRISNRIIDCLIVFAVLQWWRLSWLFARYTFLLMTLLWFTAASICSKKTAIPRIVLG